MGTVFEPPRPEPTARDLASVEAGTTREDLVARLGAPSARVLIPEDGQLREVYHFTAGGVHLGTVRLTDGEVSTIEVDPAVK